MLVSQDIQLIPIPAYTEMNFKDCTASIVNVTLSAKLLPNTNGLKSEINY